MDKPRVINLTFYGLCGATSLLSAWPNYDVMGIGLTLPLPLLIAAYIMRSRSIEDSLVHHHMTFVIRTLWIFMSLSLLLLHIAAWLIYTKGDNSVFTQIMDQASSGIMPDMSAMEEMESQYLAANHDLIIESYMTSMFPALLYLVWRVSRGASRANRNFRIQNLRSWL